MEKTDNESKIRELERKFPVNKETMTKQELSAYRQGIRCGASQMAEWKDMEIESLRDSLDHEMKHNKSMGEFLEFIHKECKTNRDKVLNEISECCYIDFKGYVEAEESVDKNGWVYHTFTLEGNEYTAQLQHDYSVCQWNGSVEDDFKGYMLFPTYDPKRFYCVYYVE